MIMTPQERHYQKLFNQRPWLPGEYVTDMEFPRINHAHSMIEDVIMKVKRVLNKMMEN